MISPAVGPLMLWSLVGLPVAGIVGASIGQARYRARYRGLLPASKLGAGGKSGLDHSRVRNPVVDRYAPLAAVLPPLAGFVLVVLSDPKNTTFVPESWQIALRWLLIPLLGLGTLAALSLAWIGMPPERNFRLIADGQSTRDAPTPGRHSGKALATPGDLDLFDAREL